MFNCKTKYKHKYCCVFGTALLLLQLASTAQTAACSNSKSALYEMKMGKVPFGIHNVTDQGKSCDSDATCGRMCRAAKDCKVAVYSPAGSKCLLTCAPPNFGYKVSGDSIFKYTLIM